MISRLEANNQHLAPDQPDKPDAKQPEQELQKKVSRPILRALGVGCGIGLLLSWLILSFAPSVREWGWFLLPKPKAFYLGPPELIPAELKTMLPYGKDSNREGIAARDFKPADLKTKLQRLQRTVTRLEQKVNRLTPIEPYLIIDTSDNLMFLKKGKRRLHQGICSTGSYIMLKSADGSEKWIFKTPRGMFRIQAKIEDPVWRMPDWAFIEEGLPVPAPYSHERYESGVLGDYALSLGDGYLIHGTLYQRFLGLPVTHGCVRLGDKELEIVYRSLHVGSKVFIY